MEFIYTLSGSYCVARRGFTPLFSWALRSSGDPRLYRVMWELPASFVRCTVDDFGDLVPVQPAVGY
jgi:hypothetical protein